MKYKELYKRAKAINNIEFFPNQRLDPEIKRIFPTAERLGSGGEKIAYILPEYPGVVIKVPKPASIKRGGIINDIIAYQMLPEHIRNKLHAKYYHANPSDKYILQERFDSTVAKDNRINIKNEWKRKQSILTSDYNYRDATSRNFGVRGDKVRIFDSSWLNDQEESKIKNKPNVKYEINRVRDNIRAINFTEDKPNFNQIEQRFRFESSKPEPQGDLNPVFINHPVSVGPNSLLDIPKEDTSPDIIDKAYIELFNIPDVKGKRVGTHLEQAEKSV